jgi:hypothetical protein
MRNWLKYLLREVIYLGKILSILLQKILLWLSLDRPFSIFGAREEQNYSQVVLFIVLKGTIVVQRVA